MFGQELRSRVAMAVNKRLGFLILTLSRIVTTTFAQQVPQSPKRQR